MRVVVIRTPKPINTSSFVFRKIFKLLEEYSLHTGSA
jgi:hypothetical protein